jgi:L-rhamnose isomerase
MRRTKLRRLAMAITATALLASGSFRAMALEVSASTFVSNLGSYVANGDIHAAHAALHQLKALGVRQLKLGNRVYDLDDLIALLANPARAQAVFAQLVLALQTEERAYFVAENRTITTVHWAAAQQDAFPTGSTG